MDIWSVAADYSDQIVVGAVAGLVGAACVEVVRYIQGWRQARRNEGADFHIAGTMFTAIDLSNPAHERYRDAAARGKTHVQELLWLGRETPLKDFLHNPFVFSEVMSCMRKTRDAGLMLGKLPESAQRPLLKRIAGYHSAIPDNDLVRLYKDFAGADGRHRVYGISPPTHEHYSGSAHRRVLRAMHVPDRLLREGLPPKDKIYFLKETHANRYETVKTLIELYRQDPARFDECRVYF